MQAVKLFNRRKCRMSKILETKIKSIIRNETGMGNERIGSTKIYDKLTSAGVEVSESEVTEVLLQLEKEKLITIVLQANQEDREKHGEYLLTWISNKL
jgi:L-lactate utilization protein LutB